MSTITPEPGAAEAVPEVVYVGRAPDPRWADDRDMDKRLHARVIQLHESYASPKWRVSIDADRTIDLYEAELRGLATFLNTLPAIEGGDA